MVKYSVLGLPSDFFLFFCTNLMNRKTTHFSNVWSYDNVVFKIILYQFFGAELWKIEIWSSIENSVENLNLFFKKPKICSKVNFFVKNLILVERCTFGSKFVCLFYQSRNTGQKSNKLTENRTFDLTSKYKSIKIWSKSKITSKTKI